MMIVKEPGEPGIRPRGRPRSLKTEQIVEAALEADRRMGSTKISMRSLANELGVPVMTIYNYVASKEALNELVVDHALRPVSVPPPEAQDPGRSGCAGSAARRPRSDAPAPGPLLQPSWQ